jgi:hypothetical protein
MSVRTNVNETPRMYVSCDNFYCSVCAQNSYRKHSVPTCDDFERQLETFVEIISTSPKRVIVSRFVHGSTVSSVGKIVFKRIQNIQIIPLDSLYGRCGNLMVFGVSISSKILRLRLFRKPCSL